MRKATAMQTLGVTGSGKDHLGHWELNIARCHSRTPGCVNPTLLAGKQLKGGKIYFGSWFQSKACQTHCLRSEVWWWQNTTSNQCNQRDDASARGFWSAKTERAEYRTLWGRRATAQISPWEPSRLMPSRYCRTLGSSHTHIRYRAWTE
jgi:hypothetical protein